MFWSKENLYLRTSRLRWINRFVVNINIVECFRASEEHTHGSAIKIVLHIRCLI